MQPVDAVIPDAGENGEIPQLPGGYDTGLGATSGIPKSDETGESSQLPSTPGEHHGDARPGTDTGGYDAADLSGEEIKPGDPDSSSPAPATGESSQSPGDHGETGEIVQPVPPEAPVELHPQPPTSAMPNPAPVEGDPPAELPEVVTPEEVTVPPAGAATVDAPAHGAAATLPPTAPETPRRRGGVVGRGRGHARPRRG